MSRDDATSARSASDIESELAHSRQRIDHTLELLEYRFRPGALIDHAWRYARARSEDGTGTRLQEAVVRNPLPVALMGVGLAWLLFSGSDGSVARADSPLAEATTDRSRTSDQAASRNDEQSSSAHAGATPEGAGPVAVPDSESSADKRASGQAGSSRQPEMARSSASTTTGEVAGTASENTRRGDG